MNVPHERLGQTAAVGGPNRVLTAEMVPAADLTDQYRSGDGPMTKIQCFIRHFLPKGPASGPDRSIVDLPGPVDDLRPSWCSLVRLERPVGDHFENSDIATGHLSQRRQFLRGTADDGPVSAVRESGQLTETDQSRWTTVGGHCFTAVFCGNPQCASNYTESAIMLVARRDLAASSEQGCLTMDHDECGCRPAVA